MVYLQIMQATTTFYDLSADRLGGGKIRFPEFRGKTVLIVNVASECGFTPQYQQLEELYQHHKDVMVVLGCPSNDFGNQEPGTHESILAFCKTQYDVHFPMTTKVKIIGDDKHMVYRWLTEKSFNGVQNAEVKWNFHKFLVSPHGQWIGSYPSSVEPFDDEILKQISTAA